MGVGVCVCGVFVCMCVCVLWVCIKSVCFKNICACMVWARVCGVCMYMCGCVHMGSCMYCTCVFVSCVQEVCSVSYWWSCHTASLQNVQVTSAEIAVRVIRAGNLPSRSPPQTIPNRLGRLLSNRSYELLVCSGTLEK